MHRKPFVVRMPAYMWAELGLDDADIYQRVLCGLFIGYGPETLRDLAQRNADDRTVKELLRVAPSLGLTKNDKIVVQ